MDGDDLRDLPLSMRKANLARLLRGRPDGIFVSDFEQGEIGPDLFRAACQMGLEGLVSKHRDRPYRGGRQKHWLKVKNRKHPAMYRVMEKRKPAIRDEQIRTYQCERYEAACRLSIVHQLPCWCRCPFRWSCLPSYDDWSYDDLSRDGSTSFCGATLVPLSAEHFEWLHQIAQPRFGRRQ